MPASVRALSLGCTGPSADPGLLRDASLSVALILFVIPYSKFPQKRPGPLFLTMPTPLGVCAGEYGM